MASHGPGEPFVLLDARTLKAISLPSEMIGSTVKVTAHGAGDAASPPSVIRAANGEAMRPLSPAQLAATWIAGGDLAIRWTRRSRLAWGWQDEVEAPVDLTVHGYRIRVSGAAGSIERDTTESEALISAAELSTIGPGPLLIEVRQVGSLALSRPATFHLNP